MSWLNNYVYKGREELFRSVMLAILGVIGAALESLDVSKVTDWRIWVASITAAAMHQAIVAIAGYYTKKKLAEAERQLKGLGS